MNEVVAAQSANILIPPRSLIPTLGQFDGCQWCQPSCGHPFSSGAVSGVAIPRLGTGRKSGRLCSAKTVCGNIGPVSHTLVTRQDAEGDHRSLVAGTRVVRFPRTSLWMHPARLCLLRIYDPAS